jgi:LmbE family N-acetylglucosaminyl deacetylase
LRFFTLILFFAFQTGLLFAQTQTRYSATEIQAALNKLNVLGSVLYIAAHPDDENQGLLSYMSKGRNYRTAYLALTRGDGGQNLLGPEKGTLLGVMRTQELLAARKIDGAQQFFTRAIDFGYSKTAKESLSKWNHQTLLGDVVKVVRTFRPDIIITRFTKTKGGHGHHLSSAILAQEAFFAAADPEQFPEQLQNLKPWQAKRIFWNNWQPSQKRLASMPPLLALNLGKYAPLYGRSFREIAAKSRTMHKSQGFGATPQRGNSFDYFELTAGDTAFTDIMDSVETSWKRIDADGRLQIKVSEILESFNAQNPQASIPQLLNLYQSLNNMKNSFWVNIKKEEIKKLIQMCSGLWLEAIAFDASVVPGETIKIKTMALNRSAFPIKINSIHITYLDEKVKINAVLKENEPKAIVNTLTIPGDAPYSQPYWLKKNPGEALFNVDKKFSGQPVGKPALEATINLSFDKTVFDFSIPVLFQENDPKMGEQYKPFLIVPDVSVSFAENVFIFKDSVPHTIQIFVHALTDSAVGEVKPIMPKGWQSKPGLRKYNLAKKGEQAAFEFEIRPTKNGQNGIIKAVAQSGKNLFTNEVIKINYPHIPPQIVLRSAEAQLAKLDINVPKMTIAYIMGSGDEIPQALHEIGLKVDLLSDEDLMTIDYEKYDAVVCGVRAFNTRENLGLYQKRILKYVENGGTWIVQHNTRFGTQVAQIGPYPYVARGRDRISEEDARMEILVPSHALFNFPNKITTADFDGWVQERGTYLAESWQGKLYPLLAGHDEGEPSKLGSLLYAPYGKGVFIFSALSMFRQLPAGVPGAYRLFVNMISAKQ